MLVDVDHVDQEHLLFLEILHQQEVEEVELMVLLVFQEDQVEVQVDVVVQVQLLQEQEILRQ
jgi:ribosomal protein L21